MPRRLQWRTHHTVAIVLSLISIQGILGSCSVASAKTSIPDATLFCRLENASGVRTLEY